ncbi:MAG: cytochrome c oxidase assembly protein [Microbacteriaceae bacterium]|nr:cytochrome c oxidase assembly protein [Microbacteriaceae bacterium]
MALAALVVVGSLYGLGVATLARRGEAWPVIRTLGFYAAGLGSFAVISFGFLGAYSTELRWAFTTRIALLLFAVPALIGIGQPITLARRALSETPLRITDAVLASWPVRLMGNAIFAPIFALAAFCVFLTPLAGSLRESAVAENILTLAVPLVGLLMVLPIIEHTTQRTSFFITVEFMLVFVELIIDAIPAILMRLNDGVLDHLARFGGIVPAWFPSALEDQHLAGDFLWFIAEVADIPILILLFIRWSKIDRKEAKQLDELSDEEMDRLTREHLRARPE